MGFRANLEATTDLVIARLRATSFSCWFFIRKRAGDVGAFNDILMNSYVIGEISQKFFTV
jgi:hypothetical protein